MSSIGAEIIEAEEVEAFADKFQEQWRQDTLKILELSEQWDGVYQQIDGVIGKQGVKNEQS